MYKHQHIWCCDDHHNSFAWSTRLKASDSFVDLRRGRWVIGSPLSSRPRISTEHTQDVDVNRQNFAWSNEYELGLSMSVGIAKRRALSTRTYPHVVFSAWVLRNPFYFLVNVALPNLLFAAMAGLQFFVDVNLVADRASISLTLLLVCASYFQFSSSLVPRLGYLTILDKHSLWCIFLVIIMVFWVGIIKMVRYHTELVDFIAATCFAIIWLLSHIWFLTRLWRSRLRSRHRLERPSSVDSHLKSVQCRKNSGIFYPVSPRPSKLWQKATKRNPKA